MWLIFICMTWIFCEKIVPSLLFPAAVRPQTFWYSPGRVATAYSTDKYKYKISWVGQSTNSVPKTLFAHLWLSIMYWPITLNCINFFPAQTIWKVSLVVSLLFSTMFTSLATHSVYLMFQKCICWILQDVFFKHIHQTRPTLVPSLPGFWNSKSKAPWRSWKRSGEESWFMQPWPNYQKPNKQKRRRHPEETEDRNSFLY